MNQYFDNTVGLLLAAFTLGTGTTGSNWYFVLAPLCAIGALKLLAGLGRKPMRHSGETIHDLRR
jgi:hypothetical protein